MGILNWMSRLFTGKTESEPKQIVQVEPVKVSAKDESEEWEEVPKYIDARPEEIELVSIIAGSIAAGYQKNSDFTIRSVKVKNPEAIEVSVLVSAIAAGIEPKSEFRIKSIKKRKEIE